MIFERIGCPNCGGPYNRNVRNCEFCGTSLVITSVDEVFAQNIDSFSLTSAAKKWRDRLEININDAEAHYALGMIYINSKLIDESIKHLETAVKIMPEVPDFHYSLAIAKFNDGKILIDSKEFSDVEKHIEYCTKLDPANLDAAAFVHFFRAVKSGSEEEKIKIYKKAIEIAPNTPVFHNNIGLAHLNSGDFACAQLNFETAINLGYKSSVLYSNMCLLKFKQKRYEESIYYGEKSVSLIDTYTLNGAASLAYNNLAVSYAAVKKYDEAKNYIEKAISLDPGNKLFLSNKDDIKSRPFFNSIWMKLLIVFFVFIVLEKVLRQFF